MVAGSLSAADHQQGMAAGRIRGINVVQELLLRGLPQPRKLVCRARKAKQGPLPLLKEQGVCKSKEVQNVSWSLTVLPQDLLQVCKPTGLALVPSQDAESRISDDKKPVLPTYIHSHIYRFPNSHLISFLQGTQGTQKQRPQRFHAANPAGAT